jgi:type IV pilus assembly protein PilM
VGKQQVLLVAAQKEMIQRYMEAAKKAGLKVAGIDVSAFALLRAVAPPVAFLDQEAASQGFGVVNISSSVSTLVVSSYGVPKFTRIVSFSFDGFVRQLVERQGIQVDDAVSLLEHVGLAGPTPPNADLYNPVTIEDVQSSLSGVADELADDIRRSLDYYHQTSENGYVQRLALTGRGALVRNLDSYLSEHLGIPVELGNPLLKLAQNSSGHPDATLAAIAPRLAVAVGLALDEVE